MFLTISYGQSHMNTKYALSSSSRFVCCCQLSVSMPTYPIRTAKRRKCLKDVRVKENCLHGRSLRANKACSAKSQLFSVSAPQWWNKHPTNVRTAESLTIFCKRIKTHLSRLIYKLLYWPSPLTGLADQEIQWPIACEITHPTWCYSANQICAFQVINTYK